MDDIAKLLSDLSSWYWWFTVVIVGLLINLASSYLKPQIDLIYERVSASRKNKNDEEKRNLNRKVEELIATPNRILLEGISELRERTFSLLTLLIGFAFTGFGLVFAQGATKVGVLESFASGICVGIATVNYIFFFRMLNKANLRSQALSLASKKLSGEVEAEQD